MNTAGKVFIGTGLAVGAFFGIRSLVKAQGSGLVGITIYDKDGNIVKTTDKAVRALVGAVPPGTVTEGDSISASIRLTNASYKLLAGTQIPVAAVLSFHLNGTGSLTDWVLPEKSYSFAAGETRVFTIADFPQLAFTIPVGRYGPGGLSLGLFDPLGITLDSKATSITVNPLTVYYGGTIVFV